MSEALLFPPGLVYSQSKASALLAPTVARK